MPRAPFNKLCTIYRGTSETKIDVPLAVDVPCRLVDQDGIFSYGTNSLLINYYLTLDALAPLGAWDSNSGLDLTLGDWIEIQEPGFPIFTVVYVRFVDWRLEVDYFQGHLVTYRHVRRVASGGLLVGGSAEISYGLAGSGGVVVGGIAIVAGLHQLQLTGSGGVLLGGDACPIVLSSERTVYVVIVVGSGGVVLGGEADITIEEAEHWLFDDFNHDGGATLNGTSLESGAGMPASWVTFNQDFVGTTQSAVEFGVVSDINLPGGLITDTTIADGVCEAAVYAPTGGGDFACGLILRYFDDDNFIDFQFDSATDDLAVYTFVSGTPTLVDSISSSISSVSTAPTILRAVMNGTTIDFYRDGVNIYSISDSDHTGNTVHGIMGYVRVGVMPGLSYYTYWYIDLL